MSLFVFFISLLIVAQHVSGNHVPIIRSWRLRGVIALCWYVPCLQEGCQVRLVGSASMDALPTNQSSAPDDGHMVDRNMLSNYKKRNKEYKKWHLFGFSYPHGITMHGQPHIRFKKILFPTGLYIGEEMCSLLGGFWSLSFRHTCCCV